MLRGRRSILWLGHKILEVGITCDRDILDYGCKDSSHEKHCVACKLENIN